PFRPHHLIPLKPIQNPLRSPTTRQGTAKRRDCAIAAESKERVKRPAWPKRTKSGSIWKDGGEEPTLLLYTWREMEPVAGLCRGVCQKQINPGKGQRRIIGGMENERRTQAAAPACDKSKGDPQQKNDQGKHHPAKPRRQKMPVHQREQKRTQHCRHPE